VKLKLLIFLVALSICSLLGAPELYPWSLEQTHHRITDGLKVPSFLVDVPPGHFAGVSVPSESLAKARRSAISDVIRQILGAIGMQYKHRYFDEVSGNVRNPQRMINDRLSGTTHGVVLDVEKNIVNSNWSKDASGQHVYFVLVYYPEKKIQEMRRLSRGAKIIATILYKNGKHAELKVSEVNGVSVIISSAEVTITKKNKFARVVTLFFWKVPSGVKNTTSISVDPVEVCSNSANIQLPIKNFGKNLVDYLLGAKFERVASLTGYDEIGRPITVSTDF